MSYSFSLVSTKNFRPVRLKKPYQAASASGITNSFFSHRVPHLLPCVAVIVQINLLDGMNVGPADVADDLFRNTFHGGAHFAGRIRGRIVIVATSSKSEARTDDD